MRCFSFVGSGILKKCITRIIMKDTVSCSNTCVILLDIGAYTCQKNKDNACALQHVGVSFD